MNCLKKIFEVFENKYKKHFKIVNLRNNNQEHFNGFKVNITITFDSNIVLLFTKFNYL